MEYPLLAGDNAPFGRLPPRVARHGVWTHLFCAPTCLRGPDFRFVGSGGPSLVAGTGPIGTRPRPSDPAAGQSAPFASRLQCRETSSSATRWSSERGYGRRGRLRHANCELSVNWAMQPTWQQIWPAGSSEQSTMVQGVYWPLTALHRATMISALAFCEGQSTVTWQSMQDSAARRDEGSAAIFSYHTDDR